MRGLRRILPDQPEEVYLFAQDIANIPWEDEILPKNYSWCVEALLEGYRSGQIPFTQGSITSELVGLTSNAYSMLKQKIPEILEAVTPEHFFVATAQFFYPEYVIERRKKGN